MYVMRCCYKCDNAEGITLYAHGTKRTAHWVCGGACLLCVVDHWMARCEGTFYSCREWVQTVACLPVDITGQVHWKLPCIGTQPVELVLPRASLDKQRASTCTYVLLSIHIYVAKVP